MAFDLQKIIHTAYVPSYIMTGKCEEQQLLLHDCETLI